MAEINVTPLVDVMLVLLIIFMVAAPLMMVGVPVQLPKTSAAKVGAAEEARDRHVTRAGEVYLREEPVAGRALGRAWRRSTPRSATPWSMCAATAASSTAG